MALEIANVINNPTGIVDKNKRPAETCGAAKQDIVVLLDTSPLMRRDATLFTDTPMYYGGKPGQAPPTAGEMLTRSGCGDTRVAVVGYGRAADGPPKLLLDFTKDPKAYDALMKSLYQPSATGTYERTQFREGALKALATNWRPDAGKVIFAITDSPGSGPVGTEGWRGWEYPTAKETYFADQLSKDLLQRAREQDAMILGMYTGHSRAGFAPSSNESISGTAQDYIKMMSRATGGYMWVREAYNPDNANYNFKYTLLDTTINYPIQIREKTVGSVQSVRGEVGKPLTLNLNDTLSQFAAASLRSEATTYSWYIDCDNQTKPLYDVRQSVTVTPSKSGKCLGMVLAQTKGNGGGCYSCPEPFPPYMHRSFPFVVDIKPQNYVPKIPKELTNIQKVIYDARVEYSWQQPAYSGSEPLVYVVRETDGNVLAATTVQQLVITDTNKTDPVVSITATGEDGQSPPVLSTAVTSTVDMRTPGIPPVSVIDEPPVPPTEPPATEIDGPATVSEDITTVIPSKNEVETSTVTAALQNPASVLAAVATVPLEMAGSTSLQEEIVSGANAVLGAHDAVRNMSQPQAQKPASINGVNNQGSRLGWLFVPLSVILMALGFKLLFHKKV